MNHLFPGNAGRRRGAIRFVFIWLCVVGLRTGARAQTHTYAPPFIVSTRHLTVEQGLPSRYVFTVGQDKQGFVWIGTLDNAYRFDGQHFHALPTAPKNRKSERYVPMVAHALTDPAGNLWLTGYLFGEFAKLHILPPGKTHPLALEDVSKQANPFVRDPIAAFAYRNNQSSFHYILSTAGKLIRVNKQGRLGAIGQYADGRGADALLGQLETPRGTLLLTLTTAQTPAGSTLIEIDSSGHVVRRQTLPRAVKPVWCEPDGTVYLQAATPRKGRSQARLSAHRLDDFLFRLSPGGQLSPLPIPFGPSPFADNDPALLADAHVRYDPFRKLFWISGMRTCFAWHPVHGVIFDLRHTDFYTNSMQLFRPAFLDWTGAVWFGTEDGVVMLTLEPDRFKRYLFERDPKSDAARSSIRGMVQQGNRLWVNAEQSLWLHPQTGQSEPVLPPGDTLRPYLKGLYPATGTRRGDIWAASTHLIHGDSVTRQTRVYPFPTGFAQNYGTALWHDGQQRVWIGHEHGLSVFTAQRKQIEVFKGYNQFSELAQNRINGFFPDKQAGGIWIAASSGLYLLDSLRGLTTRYSTQDGALPFNHILFVYPDPQQAGVYWLATQGGGLVRWNRYQRHYDQFTQKEGLSDNTLYAIYEDKYHRLWLPSNYGLMAFHRQTHQVQIFHTRNGITDEEFNRTAFYRLTDGQLFLGGLNGITVFSPDQIQPEKPVLTPLLVTQYHKLNTNTGEMVSYLPAYQQQNQVQLTAYDRLFSLAFSLLDYRHLGQTRLWYRIRGWQDNWVIQNQMELRINGLPPGNYTLDVRAETVNGDPVSPVASIAISVDKPVYLQTWFLLLCLLFTAGSVVAVFWWRNGQFIREKARLETEVARRTAHIKQDKAIIEQQAADLRASATLKTRFFANVSHEFRTPVTLLIGPIQYLSQRITDHTARQLLEAMERNARHLLDLVTDLLDLTRLDSQQLILTEQPGDMAQTIQQLVATFRPQAQYNGVNLHLSGMDTTLRMPLDTAKFETVLRNLIANAINYTSAEGTIRITLSGTGQQAVVEVADTGSGIHPDDLPHIFERYFQSNQSDKPLRGGTGIGLALSQDYCALWGGTLTVSSQPGKGSTFTLTYPIRSVSPSPAPDSTPPRQAELPGKRSPLLVPELVLRPTADEQPKTDTASIPLSGKQTHKTTILLIDDNPDIVLYTQTLLTPYFQVHTAQNGRQALDLLTTWSPESLPQLIISDVMMPELDGLALVSELRTNAQLRHIPIILLTARADLEVRLQALQLGVADYLTKPFSESELLARVQNLLARFEEQTMWREQEAEISPAPPTLSDANWIQYVQTIIRQNLQNTELSIKTLSDISNVSERQLYRRTKALTGLSPNQFIQEIRLQVAHELFELQPQAMIKTIAFQVGYQKVSYFSRIYRDRFGVNLGDPEEQLNEKQALI